MKLKTFILTMTLVLALAITGCNSFDQEQDNTTSEVENNGLQEIDSEKTQDSALENIDKTESEDVDFLSNAIELLGMAHDATESYFTNSEELYSADGNYLIGRSYAVKAFGVNTTLYTSVNIVKVINSISMNLGEENFEFMRESIEDQLGAPKEIDDTPSESGTTHVMWEVDGKLIYLYDGYGTVDLQFILPDFPVVQIVDEDFVSLLPNTIEPVLAEMEPYPALRDFIVETLDIPEEYHASTRYYYNFVDLNSHGSNEIFVIVMGPYTSGTGGSTALIAFDFEGEINLISRMTLIHTPVIISNESTKGMKDIVVMKRGGGAEASFVKLTSTGEGHYTSVNNGEILESLADIKGQLIIANDLKYNSEKELFLTLE